MGKTIIILRHGQITMYGSSLTLRGNDLADKAGKKLLFLYPKASFEIWSADDIPTKHTAMKIAKHFDVEEVFLSSVFSRNYYFDTKKIDEMLNFIRTLESSHILIIVQESLFRDLARRLGKIHSRKAYCCGIIMNESGSIYKNFEIKQQKN
jgi:hypothetical protein